MPFDKVLKILITINNIAGNNRFKIHVGDWKGITQENCDTYYKIVADLKKRLKQGTVNSLKKNIFPDLDVMGFLRRYNMRADRTLKYRRGYIQFVELTDLAKKFINESKLRKQYKIYVEAVERLLEPILDELFFLLYKKFESINVYEYMMVVSDKKLKTESKIELIKAYRRLKKIQQIQIKQDILKKFNEINKEAQNKNEKRDFMNWYNESLQIFSLLNQTIYFKTFGKTTLMLELSQEAFETLAKRSQIQKDKYFEWHDIQKNEEYQLHHIYPISYFTTKKELLLIDDYRNLIYIKNTKHVKIPHDNNLFVKLAYRNDKILLVNPINTLDYMDITNDILININNLSVIIDYNKKLLLNVR
ncbi:MAG: hypothetical protein GW779_00455 [Candidatus Altiarchaeum hamiconexum]|uniref:Uncharacterized protein n=1 Tax=Candidatus Altarchaeum hamiconexum TaxID=1803513 RepID=A0A8J8CHJ6_9ARCH|nr:hypothetical protein [Candidatus Altarchaeum hamiconexum]PIN67073.1 MAG: hypothetical protein COV98_04885 [Candidatus Altarchaeum sp. CG12_big_fil_rev_8_21_14_0_65_33_22]PIV28095.1 MAG: hypothetical protein COS36_03375 [Candidatus Altarchaeum sp. CG03_land_8_20_14_0_80_32_618]PIX48693.1 MAG: hypothetical protein COZ53_03255 [Candidatus Altarchaeum sp. CG_4_8_14_3_um_filter_33_2054]PJC13074.1 MAG: hypothetical protein CO063_04790 [Candidatus Altarchaeum sp. CG_4_9_14_0_8_um_filter_32_206]